MAGVPSFWLRRGIVSRLLWPAEALFRWVARWRRRYLTGRAWMAPVPVVVVGSIFIGGTGKTPLVRWLVGRAQAQGYCPGVVLRGYGGNATQRWCYVSADSNPDAVGDEALLLARRTGVPVVAGRDRVAAVAALVAQGDCDLVIADDGLQHYRLGRSAEIAVLDWERGLGNGRCLPAGPLREPAARLREVDLIVGNGGALPGLTALRFRLEASTPRALRPSREGRQPPEFGDSVHAVAGIGAPERFFDALRKQGFGVTPHAFPDHHRFSASDLAFSDTKPVLMTEKDAVKCTELDDGRLWFTPVEFVADDALVAAATEVLDRLTRPSQ